MDGQQFDRFTRTLASGATRRDVLKRMVGSAIGGALGMMGVAHGAAQPGANVVVCHRTDAPENPVVRITVSVNAIPDHQAHGDAIAPDFTSDASNCGGCGIVCPAPENGTAICASGVCGIECDPNFQPDGFGGCACALTDDACPNLEVVDTEACACFCPVNDIACAPGHVLNETSCTCECGPDDVNNCCGIVCPAPANGSATCVDGVCGITCDVGYVPDGAGACVCGPDDVDNCCGMTCVPPANATATCTDGQCGFVCNAGYEPDGAGGCRPIATCRPLLQTCDSADQCCGHESGTVSCAPLAGSCASGTDSLCCSTIGGTCELDCDCCPPFQCGGGGRCVAPL